jgi:flagellar protein FliL
MPAPAAVPEVAEAPPKKSKKKLIVTLATLLLLGGAGGGGFFYMKQKAAAEAAAAAASEDDGAEEKLAAPKPGGQPIYVPLDAFVVNLADKDADRFAQIGITLQVEDSKVAEQMKTYMPAIRDGILMTLAHKSAGELLERSGKEQLAAEILVSVAKAIGIPVAGADAAPGKPAQGAKAAEEDGDDEAPAKGAAAKKKAKPAVHNPVTHVLFSNFIIQ